MELKTGPPKLSDTKPAEELEKCLTKMGKKCNLKDAHIKKWLMQIHLAVWAYSQLKQTHHQSKKQFSTFQEEALSGLI